ncbi:MAG: cupin domain-containing protein [Alphaproteobacteria bacterium]|nr:cupin domain-containing protein [Alphaproteobacteria bacterium]MBU0804746.1 cupin domain-containing protein [Alphaproteobacteria bacterium]MBU0873206.1 cupin domain-containing protein [Alphaproteobacteria bacterium]MBU1403313.1 cupin domain-containing protein [Alphaproteobacteria bacterium]MBU1589649.1 cupin domain-containing protein [Alphaproteobacteria bacterium]
MNNHKSPAGRAAAASRRCVYTAIIGRYERLNEQPMAADSSIPFICLTDDPELTSESWEIRLVKPEFPGDPVRSQRLLKIMAHRVLPEFDASIYMDNTVVLSAPPEAIFERYFGGTPMALPAHSFRERLSDEFDVIALQGIDDPARVTEQREHYARSYKGVLDEPVYWNGIMLRDHADPAVRQMCEVWSAHILRYSRRDQLSINVALREAELTPHVIVEDNKHSWFHSWPHRNDRKLPFIFPDRVRQIAELKSGFEKTLKERNAEIQKLKTMLAASTAARQEMLASHSWRVTAPLRAASTAARAILTGLGRLRHRSAREASRRTAAGWKPAAPESAIARDLARDGFAGPIRLFTREQCDLILRHYRFGGPKPTPEWPKDRAVVDAFFHDLAMRPQILDRLADLLGPDVVLWGASVVERKPGQAHLVHTDIESSAPAGGFVSVWIGLEGTSRDSALAMITRSHLFGTPVQQVMHEAGLARETTGNDRILALARQRDGAAELVQPAMGDGDALFMDGRIWHGSLNTGTAKRTALLLQYARAGAEVPIQEPGSSDWPFRLTERRATCLPVLVGARPAAEMPGRPHGQAPVGSVVSQNAGLEAGADGFSPFHILRGGTPNAPDMESHVSVLAPGHSPHPPHHHVEEELLVVLDGEAEIVIPQAADDAAPRVETLRAGGLAYYPAYQFHTIRNVSAQPVTYVMLKWRGAPKETEKQLGTLALDIGRVAADEKPISMPKLFEGPTGFLTKLHAHVTTMAPGKGYPAHVDRHDVAIIVFSGEVETLGQRIGPGGTAFSAAGEEHGLSNPGTVPARYLVFEFHA